MILIGIFIFNEVDFNGPLKAWKYYKLRKMKIDHLSMHYIGLDYIFDCIWYIQGAQLTYSSKVEYGAPDLRKVPVHRCTTGATLRRTGAPPAHYRRKYRRKYRRAGAPVQGPVQLRCTVFHFWAMNISVILIAWCSVKYELWTNIVHRKRVIFHFSSFFTFSCD